MDQPMTLIDRLLNPQWMHSPYSDATLNKEQTIADMKEAAAALDVGRIERIIKSNCFVSIRSVEGRTLPTENIESIEVYGIEEAAKEISGGVSSLTPGES